MGLPDLSLSFRPFKPARGDPLNFYLKRINSGMLAGFTCFVDPANKKCEQCSKISQFYNKYFLQMLGGKHDNH
jgi:hypothetical protein